MSAASDPLVVALSAQARWTRGLARVLVADADAAEDLVQDTWVTAVRHRPDPGGSLRPWLATVMRNLARTGHRMAQRADRRHRAADQLRPAPDSPEEALARAELHERLAHLVGALGEPYRQAVVLRFFEGLSSPQIGRRLAVPEGTVRWRLKTGLDQLRRQLDETHGDRGTWKRALAPLVGARLVRRASPLALGAAAVTLLLVVVAGTVVLTPAATQPRVAAGKRQSPALVLPTPAGAPATLAGRVLDPGRRPLAGGTVWLLPRDRGGAQPGAVRTGADGGFRFSALQAGRFDLGAAAPAFAPARQLVELAAGEARGSVDLVLRDEGLVLAGEVRDASGGPVIGGRVVAGATDEAPAAALTDERGRYALRLPAGGYQLAAVADGYATARRYLRLSADTTRDFTLMPASAVAGVVIDAVTRTPVGGAAVRADGLAPGEVHHGLSDDQGRFNLLGLPAGEYQLSARRGSQAGAMAAPVAVPLAQQVAGVSIELAAALAVSGVVRDPAGRPVPAATVGLDRAVGVPFGFDGTMARARTDRHGRYRIDGLPPGRYHLAAHAPPLADSEVQTVSLLDQDRAVDLDLPPGGTLDGRVVSASGAPIAGAEVEVVVRSEASYDAPRSGSARLRSDAAGRFHAAALGRGQLTVTATTGQGRAVRVGPRPYHPGAREEVVLRFGAALSIAGRVTWSDGAPAAGARVRWVPPRTDIEEGVVATAGADGRFRLGPVDAGPGLLRAERPHATRIIGTDQVLANEQRLDLSDGRDRTDVALRLARADGTIAGLVVDDSGTPVADAHVEAEPIGPEMESAWIATAALSGRDGRFALGDLIPGAHMVRATAPGQPSSKALRVQAGAQAVRLVIPRAGTLAGLVVDGEGRPARAAEVTVLPDGPDRLPFSSGVAEGMSTTGASFSFAALAPGNYELVATTPDGKVARAGDLTLAPGERRTGVRLVLGPALTVEGQVVDHATGAPLASIGIALPWTSSHVHARTAADGTFTLPPQAPGRTLPVMIRASDQYLSETFTVTLPATTMGRYRLPVMPLLRATSVPPRRTFSLPPGLVLDLHAAGGAVVVAAAPGGPRPGDRLVAIGDQDVRGLGYVALCVIQAASPSGALHFAAADGRRHTVPAD
jgi:RNA polymerase sigma factor (sigma-70 family)